MNQFLEFLNSELHNVWVAHALQHEITKIPGKDNAQIFDSLDSLLHINDKGGQAFLYHASAAANLEYFYSLIYEGMLAAINHQVDAGLVEPDESYAQTLARRADIALRSYEDQTGKRTTEIALEPRGFDIDLVGQQLENMFKASITLFELLDFRYHLEPVVIEEGFHVRKFDNKAEHMEWRHYFVKAVGDVFDGLAVIADEVAKLEDLKDNPLILRKLAENQSLPVVSMMQKYDAVSSTNYQALSHDIRQLKAHLIGDTELGGYRLLLQIENKIINTIYN